MSGRRQAVAGKDIVASAYDTVIINVDIADKKPCAQASVGKRRALGAELVCKLVEHGYGGIMGGKPRPAYRGKP